MALETATYIDALVTSNPDGADARSTADDHLRLIKAALKRSFPMVGGAVSASALALSKVNDLSASVQDQLNILRDGSATAKCALTATTAISASSAAALGGVAAASFARKDVGNSYSSVGSFVDSYIGQSVYSRLTSTGAPAGKQQWIDRYVWYVDGSYRMGVCGDSGTWFATAMLISRTFSSAEAINFYVTGSDAVIRGIVNGTAYDLTNPIQLNGLPAATYARLDTARTFTGGTGNTPVNVASASVVTLNCALGDFHRLTLTGNTLLAAPTAARPGQVLVLALTQGGTGSYAITWSSVFRFAGGVLPTLSTLVGSRDVFSFIYDDIAGHWLQAGLNVTR